MKWPRSFGASERPSSSAVSNVALTPEPSFRFSGIERWLLEFLAVPLAPEPPEGSTESIRVFHAGQQFYVWSVIVWASRCLLFFAALSALSVAGFANVSRAGGWGQVAGTVLLVLAGIAFVLAAVVTLIARRLNYRLRWYIVTDRSLRIRSGVFSVNELTMTYGNIQEIRVSAGPLQYALGLADVEVQAAGGGGGEKQMRSGHSGRFQGLSNANEVRDLIAERVRRYRDSGLGEMPVHLAPSESPEIAAARAMLEEVRALRAVLSPR
jgi:membrane protein YdbS with pleckstrin-like domain